MQPSPGPPGLFFFGINLKGMGRLVLMGTYW